MWGPDPLPIDFSSVIEATDNDGDAITLDAGQLVFKVMDDTAPVTAAPAASVVDEDDLPAGIGDAAAGDDATITDVTLDGDADATTVAGSLDIDWGDDDANPVINGGPGLGDRGVSFASDAIATLTALSLTSHGDALGFALSASDTILTATAGGRTIFTATLSDALSGSYLFDLEDTLDHPTANTEDNIDLAFSFTATDSNGDATDAAFTVTVDDDLAVTTAATVMAEVDEADAGAVAGALVHTLDDPTPTTGDFFGISVAIDGGRVLIGARNDDTNGADIGQAHLFDAATGALLQTFDDPTPTSGDLFGTSVALSGDHVVIGALFDDTGGTNVGQVHLFDVNTGALLRTFDDPTPTTIDIFGSAIAIDGNFVLIGAHGDDTNGTNVGQAHLFDINTGTLLHTFDDPTPTAGDAFGGDSFGSSVAVDGDHILIGARNDDTNGTVVGQAHLFDATTGALIRTFDDPSPTTFDQFGTSVAISGNLVLIGAQGDDINGTDVGQAHLFDITTGVLLRTFDDPTPTSGDLFGATVSISGNHAIIAAVSDDTGGTNVGQVHVFDVNTGALLQTFDDPTPTTDDRFGTSLAIDNNQVVIGSPLDDTNGINVGQAYVFNLDGGDSAILDLTPLVDFGADGEDVGGGFSLGSNLSALPALTSNGEAIIYSVDGNTLTGFIDSGTSPGVLDAGDTTVFTLNVDPSGSATFTLLQEVDHPLGSDPLPIDFSSVIEATDGDGDVITLDAGQLVFKVTDGDTSLVRLFDVGGNLVNTFTTIQAAVDAASTGFTVLVLPGTYNENVIIDQSISLLSSGGRDVTIIDGIQAGSELGTIEIDPNVDDVTIGAVGQGFTIRGIDGTADLEKAAVYLQGNHDNVTIQGNDLVARGDSALTSEYAAAVTNTLIDSNIISGQTFDGADPAGDGFGAQFTLDDVPRQLVVMGNGNNPSPSSNNITFSNNDVTGTAGGISTTDNTGATVAAHEQGNTLITIDAASSSITGNTFTGFTNRFGVAIRARGPETDIENNTLDHTSGGSSHGMLVNDQGVPGSYSGNELIGGAGDEVIFNMTPGDDTLEGNGGDDILIGGDGDDVAVFNGVLTAANFTPIADIDPGAGVLPGWQVDATAFGEGTDILATLEIVQGTDPDGAGGSTGRFLLVGNGGFATLGDAITQAQPGDTIVLGDGTFDLTASGAANPAQLVIDKDLTIIGQGQGVSTIQAIADTGSSGDARGMFLVQPGVTLDVSNLTVSGNGHLVYQGFRHKGSGSFDDVEFTDIRFNPSGPEYQGTAVAVFGGGAGQNVDVTNSTFSNIGRIGVLYFGADVSGTFHSNNYTGKGVGDHLDYALDISSGANIIVRDNMISDNQGVASVDGSQSAGILVTTFFGGGTQATVGNNSFTDNIFGVVAGFDQTDSSTITMEAGNNISGGTAGVRAVGNVVINDPELIGGANGTFDWDGGAAANAIGGASLADELTGDDGADTINGFAGDDTLAGGNDGDTYLYASGDGNDVINEADVAGIDRLVFTDLNQADVTFSQTGSDPNDLVITVNGTSETITVDDQLLGGNFGLEEIEFADQTVLPRATFEALIDTVPETTAAMVMAEVDESDISESGALLQTFDDPTPTTGDLFGFSVALDGGRVLVGAQNDETNGDDIGQAHLYDAATGALLQTFDDPTPTARDRFGGAVAIDGNFVLVGASQDDTNGTDVGQAHLFDATTGALLQTFDDPTPTTTDNFGEAVAISGNFVLIGARNDDTNSTNVGQVHLFDAATGTLMRTFDDPTITTIDRFGQSIAIDGNLLLIGAPGDETNGVNVGQVHLFDVTTGVLLRTFDNPTPASDENFGLQVAINGNFVLIGAQSVDTNGTNVGQAYLFDVNTGALLHTFDDPNPTTSDAFGNSVAISGDKVLIGARADDTNGNNVGQVYVFDVATGVLVETFDDPTPTSSDFFGRSIAVDGNQVIIGADGDDTIGANQGQAYLFSTEDGTAITLDLTTLVDFGADGPAAGGGFGLGSYTSGLPALMSDGQNILYDATGDTLTGYADSGTSPGVLDASDRTVFTLNIDPAGSATFTLFEEIDHGVGPDPLPIDFSSVITATDGDGDTITLDAGQLVFEVRDNTITGTSGNDVLNGTSGDDTIEGLGGDDTLDGKAGNDLLTGGADDDTFIFKVGAGDDTIDDFAAGAATDDVIELDGLTAFSNFNDVIAATSQNGSDAVIDLGIDGSITLAGIDMANLHQDDFRFV